jgi:hydrogenase maturation protein HypF
LDPFETGFIEFDIQNNEIDPTPIWQGLISGLGAGTPVSRLSARFHNSVVNLCVTLCVNLRAQTSINKIALSGGVFQNKYLMEKTTAALQKQNFTVLLHQRIPTNDGGISIGQAVIASYLY